MIEPGAKSARAVTRSRLVEVAAELLATEGPAAVTTRSVALAAGVQAPMIYRLFGDKEGLLDAVAEHGFASYVAQKPPINADDDPVQGLRAGWELHIGFGVANPALFRLMHTSVQTADGRAIIESGIRVLNERVHRVARAGRLRVTEKRAVGLIHAAGTGVVFALINQPEADRDESLADLAWESVCMTILVDPPAAVPDLPVAAAVTLHASLPELAEFSSGERALFAEWLDRITGMPHGHLVGQPAGKRLPSRASRG